MFVQSFTFNDFAENTYVLYDDSDECIIVDPGCNTHAERTELSGFIDEKSLRPVQLINTHCHIDHILGNRFIAEKYGLKLTAHKKEAIVLQAGAQTAAIYQIHYDMSPDIEIFIDEGDYIRFGNSELTVLFTPGHSPASISFWNKKDHISIVGDVLFKGSIGRTDLPGGNFEILTRNIKSKLFSMPDQTIVYSGHGDPTTIGNEKTTNPFF